MTRKERINGKKLLQSSLIPYSSASIYTEPKYPHGIELTTFPPLPFSSTA